MMLIQADAVSICHLAMFVFTICTSFTVYPSINNRAYKQWIAMFTRNAALR
jgi:hypothetical protein